MSRRRKAAYTAAAAAAMSEGPAGFGARVASIPGLVRDTMSGRYDGLGKGRMLLMLLAVLYVISPVDLMPEALLTIPGMLDDAAVAAWLVGSLVAATGAYRTCATGSSGAAPTPSAQPRQRATRTIPGEVIAS